MLISDVNSTWLLKLYGIEVSSGLPDNASFKFFFNHELCGKRACTVCSIVAAADQKVAPIEIYFTNNKEA